MKKSSAKTTGSGTSGRAMRGKQRDDALFPAVWPAPAIVQQLAAQLRGELNVLSAYCRRIGATVSRQLTRAFSYARIVHAVRAQLPEGSVVKQSVSLLRWKRDTCAAYSKQIVATLSQQLTHCYNRDEWGAWV